jgi:putative membrane protein
MVALFAQELVSPPWYHVFWPGVAASLGYGVVGIVLLLLGYWLFDLVTPAINVQQELHEKNLAVAIVVAALLLGVAYVAAHVVQ